MAPNTATALRESKRNQLKDFLHVAGPLGVTHFLVLTATHNASYLRVAKCVRLPGLLLLLSVCCRCRRPTAAAAAGTES